jgi:multidrug efflux pump subunit AcrA (membrane-fusion protein)
MKKIIYFVSGVSVLVLSYFLFFYKNVVDNDIIIQPKEGEFKVFVTSTGELQAKNSIEIKGPTRVQQMGIYEMTISKLVPEGTIVKEGDFVAELDKATIVGKLKETMINLEKLESQYQIAKLDSSLSLSQARDNLENLKFAMEEAEIVKEQSTYEAPSIIRKAEIDYDKAVRTYNQAVKNYNTEVKKQIANVSVTYADLQKEQQNYEKINELLAEFTIFAPAEGMVIYAREWGGRRKEVNSTIQPWDPTVATLPDLTNMESISYINEIDIQKISKGQKVEIGLDANPDKKLTGKITRVANIGEQRGSNDSKVFEVVIEVLEKDTTLRPAMTTSNKILTNYLKKAIYIPLEAIHSIEDKNDKNEVKNFVYLKNGSKILKKEVKVGLINEESAIIESGLNTSNNILLNKPIIDDDELEFVVIIENSAKTYSKIQ